MGKLWVFEKKTQSIWHYGCIVLSDSKSFAPQVFSVFQENVWENNSSCPFRSTHVSAMWEIISLLMRNILHTHPVVGARK